MSFYRKNPEKLHYQDRGYLNCRIAHDFTRNVTLLCKVLLFAGDSKYTGAASVYHTGNQSEILCWRSLFYQESIPKRLIIPINSLTDGKVKLGKPYLLVKEISDHVLEAQSLGEKDTKKLKAILCEIQTVLQEIKPEKRTLNSNFKGHIKTVFNQDYLDIAESDGGTLFYSGLELKLPIAL